LRPRQEFGGRAKAKAKIIRPSHGRGRKSKAEARPRQMDRGRRLPRGKAAASRTISLLRRGLLK